MEVKRYICTKVKWIQKKNQSVVEKELNANINPLQSCIYNLSTFALVVAKLVGQDTVVAMHVANVMFLLSACEEVQYIKCVLDVTRELMHLFDSHI